MARVGLDVLQQMSETLKVWEWQVTFQLGAVAGINDLSLRAQTAPLVGKEFGTADRSYVGKAVRFPDKRSDAGVGSIDVDFVVHKDMRARRLMEEWQNLIEESVTGTSSQPAPTDGRPPYFGRMNMNLLNVRSGADEANGLDGVEYRLVWPGNVGSLEGDYDGEGHQTFTTTFNFSDHVYKRDVEA